MSDTSQSRSPVPTTPRLTSISGFDSLSPHSHLITVLQTPGKTRKHRDVEELLKFAMNNSFFRKLAEDTSLEAVQLCCRNMAHEFVRRGEMVFRQGEPGMKFYVILKGAVSVLVDEGHRDEQDAPILTSVALLREGQSFGELALLKSQPRAASILTDEDCDLGVLYKTDYMDIIGKLEEKRLGAVIDFLHKIPAFSRMSRGAIQRLTFYFTPRKLVRKQFLYRAGEPSNEVYIVKEGEFGLIQSITAKKSGSPMQSMNNYRGGKVMYHKADIALMGPGEFLGDLDVVRDRKRTQTSICNSTTGIVLVISKTVRLRQDYLKRFEGDDSWADIKEKMDTVNELREARIRNIEDRLLSQTPIESPSPPLIQLQSRSKSFSKCSRVNESNPVLQQIRSKILAHESTLLNFSPTPPIRKEGLSFRNRGENKLKIGLVDVLSVSPINDRNSLRLLESSFFLKRNRPDLKRNEVFQRELVHIGLVKAGTDRSNMPLRSSKTPSPERGGFSPKSKVGGYFKGEDFKDHRNEWEIRERKRNLKQVLRNMKALEIPRRNLWRSKPV